MFWVLMLVVVSVRLKAVIEILYIVRMWRRQKVLLIVFVIVLAVTPGVAKIGSVVVNMVVWLVILLISVIVLGFAVEWHVGVIISLVSAIKHVMGINYDLSWSSVVEIFVMVDPFAFMVVITLIFAVKASVRV